MPPMTKATTAEPELAKRPVGPQPRPGIVLRSRFANWQYPVAPQQVRSLKQQVSQLQREIDELRTQQNASPRVSSRDHSKDND